MLNLKIENKIVPFGNVGAVIQLLRKEGKKIAHCHGVFDLLHPGHIKHLQAARKFGDVLIVSVTEDLHVNKGPGRPIFGVNLRTETIAALECVDYVVVNRYPSATAVIEVIKPDFFVKGQEYRDMDKDIAGAIADEKAQVEKFGGQLVFTEEIVFSSSKLINENVDTEDDQLSAYLREIRKKTSFDKLLKDFERIAKYRVLVVGDVILDEYQFVNSIGVASKSSALTARRQETELYAGGALAVANHISNFVREVKLVSSYGVNYGVNYLEFIKEKLNPNVEFFGVYTPDRPTVLKRRFVETSHKQKLFEVIEIDDRPLSPQQKTKLTNLLDQEKDPYDLIFVADFGHGLIDGEVVQHIVSKKDFLAVNTQTNSDNKGYNFLTKYPRCDYFSIDQEEARLAVHEKFSPEDIILDQLMQITSAQCGAITLGVQGSLVAKHDVDYKVKTPIFSKVLVDTIGAGDALFSIMGLMAKQGNSIEEVGFVGNAVGAMAVRILGNKSYIEKGPLLKYLKTLLA